MDLASLLTIDRCLADQRFASKTACLADLARRAGALVGIAPGPITEAIQHREALGSTGLGNGIALPHARLTSIGAPFALLTRLREPIPFDAVDDKPVDVVCLILLPAAKSGEQLNVLACVARRLREPEVLTAVRKARDIAALHTALIGPGRPKAPG